MITMQYIAETPSGEVRIIEEPWSIEAEKIASEKATSEIRYSEPIADKIEALKKQLSLTDYQALKYAEGRLIESEYREMRQLRQQWRDEINSLEEVNAHG